MTTSPIYLDYNATTPLDSRVLDAMMPYFTHEYGNAASAHHEWGRRALDAVDQSRAQVASLIGADPREIVFTSGATESNNLALKGVIFHEAYRNRSASVVSSPSEHLAVLDPLTRLKEQGHLESLRFLPIDADGTIQGTEALESSPMLVSVMHANNETGVIHDLRTLFHQARELGAICHTDATQSVGKIPVDVDAMNIDLLSLSAHKIYGPKGVGALYVRRKRPRVRVAPILEGGGHEQERRSGTLNVPGIVGLGMACELAQREREKEEIRLGALRARLEGGLKERVPSRVVHGEGAPRLPGTSNISFPGIPAEALIAEVPQLALSTSSACTSAKKQPSYVLRSMGVSPEQVDSSVRVSLGRPTTESDVEATIEILARAVSSLREKKPGGASSCEV